VKKCTSCGETKPYEGFYRSSTYKDGYGYRCKVCDNKARHKYEQNHKGRLSKQRKYNQVKHMYGLSPEEFDKLMQHGVCEICGKKPQHLCVDHDHSTGSVRGALCQECNKALGLFKDDITLLLKAKEYLKNAEIH